MKQIKRSATLCIKGLLPNSHGICRVSLMNEQNMPSSLVPEYCQRRGIKWMIWKSMLTLFAGNPCKVHDHIAAMTFPGRLSWPMFQFQLQYSFAFECVSLAGGMYYHLHSLTSHSCSLHPRAWVGIPALALSKPSQLNSGNVMFPSALHLHTCDHGDATV